METWSCIGKEILVRELDSGYLVIERRPGREYAADSVEKALGFVEQLLREPNHTWGVPQAPEKGDA